MKPERPAAWKRCIVTAARVAANALAWAVPPPLPNMIHSSRPSEQPTWSGRVHVTHEARCCGGFVFCVRCGSVAEVPKSKALLFSMCRAAGDDVAWQVPSGSKSRLQRIRRGRYPLAHIAKSGGSWLDGRPAAAILPTMALTRQQTTIEVPVLRVIEGVDEAIQVEPLPEEEPSWSLVRQAAKVIEKVCGRGVAR